MKPQEASRNRIYTAVVLLFGFILMAGAICSNLKIVQSSTLNEIQPETMQYGADGGTILEFQLDKSSINQNTLTFHTSHQLVYVYDGDQMLYALEQTGGVWGDTTGSVWNFVVIPEKTTSVVVRLQPCYPEVEHFDTEYYLGLGREIYTGLMFRAMWPFLISLLIIIIGCYILIYWLLVRRSTEIDGTMFYLGTFSIILGCWSINETDVVTLVFEARIASSFVAFVLLMLMGIPFAMFVREFLEIGDHKIWRFFCNTSRLEIVVCCILHFTGILELRRSVIFTHVILVGALLYLIGCIIYKVIARELDTRLKISAMGLGFVFVATVMDLVNYYREVGDADVFGRVAFLFFIIILGIESARQTIAMLDKGRKAKALEEFALSDAMTGFYNRNAYDQYLKNEKGFEDHMLVTFDLNNLKKCNDEYGHGSGDKYIVKCAEVIESVFQNYGQCYRIGGDEFCCIIPDAKKCPIDHLIRKMNQEVNLLNKQNIFPVSMGIACGYSTYETGDQDMEDVRERADHYMYRDKADQKR